MTSTSIPLGGILLIDRVEKEYGLFSCVFKGMDSRVKDFSRCVKLHVYNKLTHGVSVHQICETYPPEIAEYFGLEDMPSERSLYRVVEGVGDNVQVLLSRLQKFVKDKELVDSKQNIDFSSTYFEGTGGEMGAKGYSRDHRPGNPQITFGLSIGINGIPTALTIQKGNVQDKKHMNDILDLVSKVCPKDTLLIFDNGANTKANKEKIRRMGCHYLTLRAKKVGAYKGHIKGFSLKGEGVEHIVLHERDYYCLKKESNGEYLYVYFCPQLYQTCLEGRKRKFERNKKKGNKMLKKRKIASLPSDDGWVNLEPHLQKTLQDLENPYITGLEGFFILESSLNKTPEEMIKVYKERDKAEKFIMALKDGLEIRPIRHWNKSSVLGIIFICFLANTLINLTQNLIDKQASGKTPNVKLLKKSLINLTVTIIKVKDRLKTQVVSNITPKITEVFGELPHKYEDKTLKIWG